MKTELSKFNDQKSYIVLIARKNTIFVLSGASEEFLNGFSSTGREVSPMVLLLCF